MIALGVEAQADRNSGGEQRPDVEIMRQMRCMNLEDRPLGKGGAGLRRKREADESEEVLGTEPSRCNRKRRKWGTGRWFVALLVEMELEKETGKDGRSDEGKEDEEEVNDLFATWTV